MKVLTVYYSRTGMTGKVAREIHRELGGDLEELQDTWDRSGILGYLLSGLKAALKKRATIQEVKNDPGQYDLVVIGTPVWSHTISTPVRAYLERYGKSIKAAACFATCGSTGITKTLRDLESLVRDKPRARLEIKKADLNTDKYREKVKLFTLELLHPSGN